MSRPPISYPTPIPGPSMFPSQPHNARSTLEPGVVSSDTSTSRRPSGQQQASTSSSRSPTGALDSHITRLLVTTKQLLQGLESWAQGGIGEDEVSDIYVRLGNGFEVCVTAFKQAGISTSELDAVPQELRVCLEPALSEEPCQETLNKYLPHIRSIIYNLLNGLKQKQAAYKRLVTERQPEAQSMLVPQARQPSGSDAGGNARVACSKSGASASSHGSISPASTSSQLPATKVPSSQALAERQRAGPPARPAPPDAFRPPRMRGPDTAQQRTVSPSVNATEQPQLIRHQLNDKPVPSPPNLQPAFAPQAPPKPTAPHPDRFSRDSFGNPRPISRFSADSDMTNGSPIRSLSTHSPPRALQPLPEVQQPPPTLPTLNLPSTSFQLNNVSPEPPTVESMPDVPPETRATLAALQRSDALERRASKRFSSFTFNKMVPGSPNHAKASSAGSPQRPTRRAERQPPMPQLRESVASSNLALGSDDEGRERSSSPLGSADYLQANGNESRASSRERSTSPPSLRNDTSSHSVRLVRTPDGEKFNQQSTPRPSDVGPSPNLTSASISLFLQIGRQVKKATLERPISLSSLRLLFMERFEYDPGMEDFPDVYIRDNRTGVQFELEEMDDLQDGCVLSLNIEPLDQVKQHFDLTFATMMQEIKEMKSSLDLSRRVSMTPAQSLLTVSPSHMRPQTRPPEAVARSPSPSPRPSGPTDPAREAEMRAHYEEVQSLRRDLAVMRQIHVDFLADTKDSFTKLRTQNSAMQEVVKTKMGGSRALLDKSKTKLEAQCAETIQAVEEISDIIDTAREDAFRRFVTPSRSQMASIRANLKKATEMVDQFTSEVTAVEPTWRATWHLELSRVMEEQKLLPYQSKLCSDLKNDVRDATDMLQNVQDFVNQRQAGVGRTGSKSFRPPSPDEGGGIPNLLMEIRTKESDPTSRLKAIEAQQKAREREKANQTDEFSSELTGFVQGRRLKKTGGTEEVERTRQRRQDQTIRRMLTGDGGSPPIGVISPQTTGVLSPVATGTSGKGLRASVRSSSDAKV